MEIFNQTATASGQEKSVEADFNEIVRSHISEIYNFARHMLRSPQEAEDITQKTFLSLYEHFSSIDISVSVRPWLYRVARNHCLDYLRKKKALQFSDVEEQIAIIPDHDEAIEQKLDSQLFQDEVKSKLSELPPAMKEVMLLRYFEDMTFEQIADVVDAPVNTVKSNFYRGKARLLALLDPTYGHH